jgi:hypothetical protein
MEVSTLQRFGIGRQISLMGYPRGRQSGALAQISVINQPLKAMITDLKCSPFGIDIGNFEIQLLD